jgi:DUF1016 N-terminal domain
MSALAPYAGLLAEIKSHIQTAQTRAVLAVNGELIRLYWQIGQLLNQRQALEGWGAGVIPRLARDIRNELPEVKGFSERNIDRMLAFARAYPQPALISPQPVAKPMPAAKAPRAVAKLGSSADSLRWQLPWGHHAVLMEKVGAGTWRRSWRRAGAATRWRCRSVARRMPARERPSTTLPTGCRRRNPIWCSRR